MTSTSSLLSSSILHVDQEGVLLHGLIKIKICSAENLRNVDGIGGNKMLQSSKFVPGIIKRDLSDPFCSVYLGKHRVAKTKVIKDNLSPVWNESFQEQIAHVSNGLLFVVKDFSLHGREITLGRHFVPAESLIEDDESGRPKKVVIDSSPYLDSNPDNGRIHFEITYVPIELINVDSSEVPGVYFQQLEGNMVHLYVNADDDGSSPQIFYGGENENDQTWQPQRLWKDIYDKVCDAQYFIYVSGWSVDTKISLLRGADKLNAEENSPYSPYIGPLFKQKADEGVIVNMLVWDDLSSKSFSPNLFPGVMGTHDEESKSYFKDTKVKFKLVPVLSDDQNTITQKLGKSGLFTHHQKFIILDAESQSGNGEREIMVFLGGLDITDGRFDNQQHSLFKTLGTIHKGDAYNKCVAIDTECGPRQPWRDIHCSLVGPGVMDVVENFTGRWTKQCAKHIDRLVDLSYIGLDKPPRYESKNMWATQVFRSIDSRCTTFNHFKVKPESPFRQKKDDAKIYMEKQKNKLIGRLGKVVGEKGMEKAVKGVNKKANKLLEKVDKLVGGEKDEEDLDPSLPVVYSATTSKKGREVDSSVHTALVYNIRKAKHYVYIETQYFVGNCNMWKSNNDAKCGNLIASEILLKICHKIMNNERFAAYIVIPMFPEGDPSSEPVQAILYWQYLTIESMYTRIARALKEAGSDLNPTDYLNFYCLANREISVNDASTLLKPPEKPIDQLLNQTRRHQIYIHSKLCIIDDSVVLIGSANINQRSLDGSRDTEIVIGSCQPAHTATESSMPRGDVHGFRLHVWVTMMNKMDDKLRNPNTLECVRYVNAIAEQNFGLYIQDECCEMDSYLITYPIEVSYNGSVKARSELKNGCFPDTTGKVCGKYSMVIPNIVTT